MVVYGTARCASNNVKQFTMTLVLCLAVRLVSLQYRAAQFERSENDLFHKQSDIIHICCACCYSQRF